jgi:hypothetical protein
VKSVQEQVQAAGEKKVNEIIAKVKHGGGEGAISKSEAMRQLHAAGMSTWAISKVMTAAGVPVSPQFVNNVLTRHAK